MFLDGSAQGIGLASASHAEQEGWLGILIAVGVIDAFLTAFPVIGAPSEIKNDTSDDAGESYKDDKSLNLVSNALLNIASDDAAMVLSYTHKKNFDWHCKANIRVAVFVFGSMLLLARNVHQTC